MIARKRHANKKKIYEGMLVAAGRGVAGCHGGDGLRQEE
jgi:hypothetical protein